MSAWNKNDAWSILDIVDFETLGNMSNAMWESVKLHKPGETRCDCPTFAALQVLMEKYDISLK